jgi:hypothetical protein
MAAQHTLRHGHRRAARFLDHDGERQRRWARHVEHAAQLLLKGELDGPGHVKLVEELKQRVKPEHHGHPLGRQVRRECPLGRGSERVANAKHRGGDARKTPERRARVEVGCDQVRELGEAVEGHRRLVLRVIEGRVRGGAVVRVAADENCLLHPVPLRVLEDGAGAAEVDARAFLVAHLALGDRGHVDDGLGALRAEEILRRALADIGLNDAAALGRLGPGPAVEAEHFVAVPRRGARRPNGRSFPMHR